MTDYTLDKIERYKLKTPIPVEVTKEDDMYIARAIGILPNHEGSGDTETEAISELGAAITEMITHLRNNRTRLQEPSKKTLTALEAFLE